MKGAVGSKVYIEYADLDFFSDFATFCPCDSFYI